MIFFWEKKLTSADIAKNRLKMVLEGTSNKNAKKLYSINNIKENIYSLFQKTTKNKHS